MLAVTFLYLIAMCISLYTLVYYHSKDTGILVRFDDIAPLIVLSLIWPIIVVCSIVALGLSLANRALLLISSKGWGNEERNCQ